MVSVCSVLLSAPEFSFLFVGELLPVVPVAFVVSPVGSRLPVGIYSFGGVDVDSVLTAGVVEVVVEGLAADECEAAGVAVSGSATSGESLTAFGVGD